MSESEISQDIVNRKRKYEEDIDSESSNNETFRRKFLKKEILTRRTGLLDLADEVLLEILKLLDGESLISLAK